MRIKKPDKKNAQSIAEAAKRDMDFTLTLPITNASAPTIIRNIYEAFRGLGDSLLVADGIYSKHHTQQIKKLVLLNVNTPRPLRVLENLRTLRHNINYYGHRPSIEEVKDAVDFARKCFKLTYRAVHKKLQ